MTNSSRLTSSDSVMRPVWIPKMRRLVLASGSGNSILRSTRPGRSSAGSRLSMRFVAKITWLAPPTASASQRQHTPFRLPLTPVWLCERSSEQELRSSCSWAGVGGSFSSCLPVRLRGGNKRSPAYTQWVLPSAVRPSKHGAKRPMLRSSHALIRRPWVRRERPFSGGVFVRGGRPTKMGRSCAESGGGAAHDSRAHMTRRTAPHPNASC